MPNESQHKNWLVPVLALLLLLGGWLLFRAVFPPFTPPALPAANGYDDFLQAADMLAERTGFYQEMAPEELRSVVEQNRPALELVREGLKKECRVPLDWSADRAWLDTVHMKNIESMRTIARALAAEARQANLDGDLEHAVQCGLQALELANKCSRGGLLVDRMVAGGVHYTALFSLQSHVSKLGKRDAMRLLQVLQSAPLQLDPPVAIQAREKVLFRQINGGVQTFMMSGVLREQHKQAVDQMKTADTQHAVLETLLQTHIALHAYRLDHEQQFPEKLDALVPEYLDRVPLDEFSGAPLIYRRTDRGFLIYSVGPDGVDNGGVERTDGEPGDLVLEVSK